MERTSFGLAENTESALAYVLWFVTGIFFLLMEEENKTVRFHALQSVILSFFLVILIFVMSFILPAVPFIPVVWGIEIVLWLLLIVRSYQGQMVRLPVIGAVADAYS
jgi:uncharacterized membrane protein